MTTYIVKGEHTLGYILENLLLDGQYYLMGVLAGSVLRGGHDWKNGATCFSPEEVRLATLEDFRFFRVMAPPNFQ